MNDTDRRLAALELVLRELMTELRQNKHLDEDNLRQVSGRAIKDRHQTLGQATPRSKEDGFEVADRIDALMVTLAPPLADSIAGPRPPRVRPGRR